MGTTRVIALGTGWLLLLAGAAACVGAVGVGVSCVLGLLYWPLVFELLGGGVLAMVVALGLMFFGVTGQDDTVEVTETAPIRGITNPVYVPRHVRRRLAALVRS